MNLLFIWIISGIIMVRAICPITISVVDNSGLSRRIKKDKKEKICASQKAWSFANFQIYLFPKRMFLSILKEYTSRIWTIFFVLGTFRHEIIFLFITFQNAGSIPTGFWKRPMRREKKLCINKEEQQLKGIHLVHCSEKRIKTLTFVNLFVYEPHFILRVELVNE